MRRVSSGPLWAEVTLRMQGIPYDVQAFLIFSQWAMSEVEPIRTTTLPPAWGSRSSCRQNTALISSMQFLESRFVFSTFSHKQCSAQLLNPATHTPTRAAALHYRWSFFTPPKEHQQQTGGKVRGLDKFGVPFLGCLFLHVLKKSAKFQNCRGF